MMTTISTTTTTTTTDGNGERYRRLLCRRRRDVDVERGRKTSTSSFGVDEFAWCATTAYGAALTLAYALDATARARRDGGRRTSLATLAPLCALYAILLARSWTPETLSLMMPGSLEEGLATGNVQFVPTLRSIMTLLSARATATSAWTHLMCVNVFVARHVVLKTRERVNNYGHAPPFAHTLVLAVIAGPLGLISHVVTSAAYDALRRALFADVRDDATTARAR